MSHLRIEIRAPRLRQYLEKMKGAPDDFIRKFKKGAGELAAGEMVREAPFDKGFLSMLIVTDESRPDAVSVESTASYTKFVVGGTGLFGPLKRRIFPKVAKALRFKYKGSVVFARSTAGMKPNPFVRRAAETLVVTVKDFVRDLIAEVYG